MEKNKNFDNIIHSDSSGRLYIKSHDFFNQPKVREMVSAMMDSSIFKKITEDKNKR
ncbi:hypothetical protein ACJVDH_11210 [Pedobacter sp. AW1-32]|uniref:hypothetical protein n=1 Tax=Pedobacter sp. AW1-32 TaxID=3383026 RepID=UPI003FED415A